jgi:hypothetical protein
MSEDITSWLRRHGNSAHLTVALAKELAGESLSGWFISSHRNKQYVVGKFAEKKMTFHHIVTEDDGKPRYFSSVAEARAFLQDELNIIHVHTFDF